MGKVSGHYHHANFEECHCDGRWENSDAIVYAKAVQTKLINTGLHGPKKLKAENIIASLKCKQ